MLEIERDDEGRLRLSGRFDASQAEKADATLDALDGATELDLGGLSYISSLGLGSLLKTQKRLRGSGSDGLKLVNVGKHIHDIFRLSGFHQIFEIEAADD